MGRYHLPFWLNVTFMKFLMNSSENNMSCEFCSLASLVFHSFPCVKVKELPVHEPVLALPVTGSWLKSPSRDRTLLLCNYPSQLFRSHCIPSPEHKQCYFKPHSGSVLWLLLKPGREASPWPTPQRVELPPQKKCFSEANSLYFRTVVCNHSRLNTAPMAAS